MSSYAGNGSTLAFATNEVSVVKSFTISIDGNPIDVTDLSDTTHVSISGLPSYEVKATTVGCLGTASIGDIGTLAVTMSDATTPISSITNWLVTSMELNAELDGDLNASYTFVPSANTP